MAKHFVSLPRITLTDENGVTEEITIHEAINRLKPGDTFTMNKEMLSVFDEDWLVAKVKEKGATINFV